MKFTKTPFSHAVVSQTKKIKWAVVYLRSFRYANPVFLTSETPFHRHHPKYSLEIVPIYKTLVSGPLNRLLRAVFQAAKATPDRRRPRIENDPLGEPSDGNRPRPGLIYPAVIR